MINTQNKIKFFGDSEKDQSEDILKELNKIGLIVYTGTKTRLEIIIKRFDKYLEVNNVKQDRFFVGYTKNIKEGYYYYYINLELMSHRQSCEVLLDI